MNDSQNAGCTHPGMWSWVFKSLGLEPPGPDVPNGPTVQFTTIVAPILQNGPDTPVGIQQHVVHAQFPYISSAVFPAFG